MTVFELIIAIALIGLLTALMLAGLRYFRSSDLRGATAEVSAMLRAAANMATTTGKHHRVVFDLEEGTYKIEMCEGDIKLRKAEDDGGKDDEPPALYDPGQDTTVPPEIRDALSPEDAAKAAQALSGTRLGEARCVPPVLPTGDSDARGAERALGPGVEFRRLFVQHLEGEQTDGIVRLNFFPLGYAEKAYIELQDDDGTRFALLVHGLTGRIEFKGDRFDPDDHMSRRADGERVEDR